MLLPLSNDAIRTLKKGFDQCFAKHPEIDPLNFWAAWPSFREAIDALLELTKWRDLPDEFRYTLVAQMQTCGIHLPVDFLRAQTWLLDLEVYPYLFMDPDRPGHYKAWHYDYGFEVERRKVPR